MSDWKSALETIGDDYLIGLTNKGIVKRAYKDKEDTETEVLSLGGEASVKVGEETVTIRIPLGDSKCTCPSRSICRHVILGILVLREKCGEMPGAGDAGASEKISEGVSDAQTGEGSGGAQDNGAGAVSEDAGAKALKKEIADYPVSSLRKSMGIRNYQNFLRQVKAGIRADISQTGVAVVRLPGDLYRVTLLMPLEHSACTCHKKEFCAHKAEAVLWCKLANGEVTEEELSGELLESPEFSLEKIRETAEQMKDFLLELLETGLPRTSPDILSHLERLSLVAHEAALANFEGYFRALHDSYQRYLKRVATFETKDLLMQLMRLYKRVNLLSGTESASQIARLAGEFRADYLETGTLELKGVAAQEFESQSGYAGVTVYFLEEKTQEWYSYTVARPVFYDTKGKSKNQAKAQAPWGLDMPVENMAQISIKLSTAKCSEQRRLSSSQESRAEIQSGKDGLSFADTKWYYRDFGKLFREQIQKKESWLSERDENADEEQKLVFLQPTSCEKANFDEIDQKLSMPLYDGEGREVTAELSYSKREAWGIRYLERIRTENPPCFFGKIYLKDGKIRMYPIATFEIPAAGGESVKTVKKAENTKAETEETKRQKKQQTRQALAQLLEEVFQATELVIQGGFDTPTDAVLEELENLAKLTGQYGMEFLSELLETLCQTLKQRRHSMERQNREKREEPADILCKLMEYIYLSREKVVYDTALENYQ